MIVAKCIESIRTKDEAMDELRRLHVEIRKAELAHAAEVEGLKEALRLIRHAKDAKIEKMQVEFETHDKVALLMRELVKEFRSEEGHE